MSVASRFARYAAAFEESYVDDDWSRLEEFFTEDAVYAVSGERFEGRDALLAGLKRSVDGLDRRFDERKLEPRGEPELDERSISFGWRAIYRKPGLPDLVIGGRERAEFEGERIKLLEDVMDEGVDERVSRYLAEHLS